MNNSSIDKLSQYDREDRPWGSFERFTHNEQSTVKIIRINPGEVFSLQQHEKRNEFWSIVSGRGFVTIGDQRIEAHPQNTFMVTSGTKHRAEAGPEGLIMLEIAFGTFEEGDIKRLEDKYGRN